MSTAARMLSLLSLLQTHRYWPGDELSRRLEVSDRTLRRDIERLRDLGYVVDSARGTAGGYQLRAGGQLPPLLIDDDEAVAIAVGLRAAAGQGGGGVAGLEETAVQALTKVLGLMPPRLRRRMDALASQTEAPAPWSGSPVVDPAVLTSLAQACRDDEAVSVGFTARDAAPDAAPVRRRLEPHRLVTLGRRWYLVAYDRDRQDWRSFRLDRLSDVETTGQRFRPRELPAADAVTFVQSGLRSAPQPYRVRVRIAAPLADVERAAKRWATLTEEPDGRVLLEMNVPDLLWPTVVLARVGAAFEVESPTELREELGRVARLFAASADGGAVPQDPSSGRAAAETSNPSWP